VIRLLCLALPPARPQAVIDACERALEVANTSHYALGRLQRQALEARWDVQMELEAGGLSVSVVRSSARLPACLSGGMKGP